MFFLGNEFLITIKYRDNIEHLAGDHGGAVVTHSPPISEVGGSNPRPYVGKLAAAYQWWQFTLQNFHQLYVVVSSAHKTSCCDMTHTVLEAALKPK